jgi:hypothetical protein
VRCVTHSVFAQPQVLVVPEGDAIDSRTVRCAQSFFLALLGLLVCKLSVVIVMRLIQGLYDAQLFFLPLLDFLCASSVFLCVNA